MGGARRPLAESLPDASDCGGVSPVFVVASGMCLELGSVADAPARLAVFFLLLLGVRGLPALVLYRNDLVACGGSR